MDEVTSSLDKASGTYIVNGILEYMKGKTVLLVSHEHEILELMDRIIYLSHGKINFDGTPEEYFEYIEKNNNVKTKLTINKENSTVRRRNTTYYFNLREIKKGKREMMKKKSKKILATILFLLIFVANPGIINAQKKAKETMKQNVNSNAVSSCLLVKLPHLSEVEAQELKSELSIELSTMGV